MKPPCASAEHVYRYLGRYTHRVAISNRRLLAVRDGRVVFRYKDYADNNRLKSMSLDVAEFIRRFLLHVLPSGFVRIRHYGLLASGNINGKLRQCLELLTAGRVTATTEQSAAPDTSAQAESTQLAEQSEETPDCGPRNYCPNCGQTMQRFSLQHVSARLIGAGLSSTNHTHDSS